jgi:hypothetical protein
MRPTLFDVGLIRIGRKVHFENYDKQLMYGARRERMMNVLQAIRSFEWLTCEPDVL